MALLSQEQFGEGLPVPVVIPSDDRNAFVARDAESARHQAGRILLEPAAVQTSHRAGPNGEPPSLDRFIEDDTKEAGLKHLVNCTGIVETLSGDRVPVVSFSEWPIR